MRPTRSRIQPNQLSRHSAGHYGESIDAFCAVDPLTVVGTLTSASGPTLEDTQVEAWKQQIALLQEHLSGVEGWLFLEFAVPRLGSRIDGVIITGSAVIPIEFKVGESHFKKGDYNQAWDYALDLKNFHLESREQVIFPVLCATAAEETQGEWQAPHPDGVYPPVRINALGIREVVRSAAALSPAPSIDPMTWATSPYRPSPTIVEAARALYARHSVRDIARSDAGAQNLNTTSASIEAVIDEARQQSAKAIVFVTGVPGAGKTLVGLNVATARRKSDETHAVFLSGNGPLVRVLQEALVQDQRRQNPGMRTGEVRQQIKPFIQNVHHFRDEGLRDSGPPPEHVVIFDEAQRAWDRAKTASFMARRKGRGGFNKSEPEFLLSYMDRHDDWAVVVCLVGGGQEIHTGEAGIAEWLDAVRIHFPNWKAYISPRLHDSEYAAGEPLERLGNEVAIERRDELHLSVSMRSFRSETVSLFVKAMLDADDDLARELLTEMQSQYPIVMTRDRKRAKLWLKSQARGSERYGMVASSQALRLKAYCIDVRVNVDPVKYFLAAADDTRSSFYLEDVATEFQTQGLELDWVCVNWDADLRRVPDGWKHHEFRGSQWNQIRKDSRRRYLLNAYRVLLTRARQGMVVFVPRGRKSDPTILPEYYSGTANYLSSLGIPEL